MPYPADLNRPLALLAASTLWDNVGSGALVIACSGGPDSVALARAASELLADPQFTTRFTKLPRLLLWHLDHGLREDSVEDSRFVEQLADELRAEAVVERAQLGAQVQAAGGNAEALARTERYTRLLALLGTEHNWRAVTGHHLDDQAETVLHHLVRGTHLAGLRGIMPAYRGIIYRPWLELRRTEILAYLESRKQQYRVDPTNEDTALTRNLLRHQVLPLLEQVNRGATEHIARLSQLARAALTLQEEELAELNVQVFNADELTRWLPLLGWPRGYEVHRLWEGWEESGQLSAYARRVLAQRYSNLTITEHESIGDWARDPDIPLTLRDVQMELIGPQLMTVTGKRPPIEPVNLKLSDAELHFDNLRINLYQRPARQWQLFRQRDRHAWERLRPWSAAVVGLCSLPPGAPAWECYLGKDLALPLRLRTWKVGERMELVSGGSATIGDLFTNAKVPEPLRPIWCVLADAQDRALWLPGLADGAAMRFEGEPQLLVRIQAV